MSDNYQDVKGSLFEAINTIVDSELSNLRYDKTIKSSIEEIRDLDTGEYMVRYQGNIFPAFAQDPANQQYRVDDEVYVIVPEGDFSNTKLITGKVTSTSVSEAEANELQNSIFDVSPSLKELYPDGFAGTDGEWGVIAGYEEASSHSRAQVFSASAPNDLFATYNKSYNLLKISGEFLTAFQSAHTHGNYGLKVEFYAKALEGEEPTIVTYTLDLASFNGSPYTFQVYSPQYAIVQVQKNFLLGVKSITLFEENFDFDMVSGVDFNTKEIIKVENRSYENIFVRNVDVTFVELKDLTDTGYYLAIAAPAGTSLDRGSDIVLQGCLYYQGKDLINATTCECQWYERDLSITTASAEYDDKAGIGWKILKGVVSPSYIVSPDQVAHHKYYKLIVIYNRKNILSAEIEVTKGLTNFNYKLDQFTKGKNITLAVTSLDGKGYVGDWYLRYPDGAYINIGNDTREIDVTQYFIYSTVTFYCAVKYNSQVLDILDITINGADNPDKAIVYFTGEDSYRYDANGDVTIEDSERARTLEATLTWAEGSAISNWNVAWYLGDLLLNQNPQSPSDSMMQNLWVDTNNILHYNIKQRYRLNSINNTLTFVVTTITGLIFRFDKEIIFLKDGDLGTNGTTYTITIRPCTAAGDKLAGFNPLVYQNGFINSLLLRCFVYNDGELINSSDQYSIDYIWKVNSFNKVDSLIHADALDKITISSNGIIDADKRYFVNGVELPLEFYVSVQANIRPLAMNERAVSIYAIYPIDVLIDPAGTIDKTKVDISTIPSYIKYTTSGVQPSYYNDPVSFIYDGQVYDTQNSFNIISSKLLKFTNYTDELKLRPAASFIFERESTDNNIGVLECKLSDSQSIIHSIIMYLDTYGNESINSWDGTKLEIDEENGQYVYAPTVGAGKKDDQNKFSGVVMGVDAQQQLTGLYGYQHGENTYGLKEDGTAFFGAKSGGGQIVINGKNATVYGGNGGNDPNGMTITLANKNPGSATSAIKIGNGVFEVLYDGSMYSTRGEIAGWLIEPNQLSSGSGSSFVALNSEPIGDQKYGIWLGRKDPASAPFSVDKNGNVYAVSGQIADWKIQRNVLLNTDTTNNTGMSGSGYYRFWANCAYDPVSGNISYDGRDSYFWVDRYGKMSCSSAFVRGTIESSEGYIGGWHIGQTTLSGYAGGSDARIVLDSEAGTITVGDVFQVDGKNNKGKIAGWIINTEAIMSERAGTETSDGWKVTLKKDGQVYFNQVTIVTGAGNPEAYYLGDSGKVYPYQMGHFGIVTGESASSGDTYNIGIQSDKTSIILKNTGSQYGSIALRSRYQSVSVRAGNGIQIYTYAGNQDEDGTYSKTSSGAGILLYTHSPNYGSDAEWRSRKVYLGLNEGDHGALEMGVNGSGKASMKMEEKGNIAITGTEFKLDVPADKITGVYARFK